MTHRHNPLKANRVNPAVSQAGVRTDDAEGVSHIGFEIGWGYVKQVDTSVMTARVVGSCLRLSERPVSIRETR